MTRRAPTIARISPDGDVVRLLERFKNALAGATEAAEKGAGAKQPADVKEIGNELSKAIKNVVLQDVAQGAVRSLGAAGAGAVDAGFAGVRALQGALPALGGTFAQSQGLPFAAGTLAGTAGAALLERQFGPEAQARERALAEVQQLYAPAAAQGQTLTKEELAEAFERALAINRSLAKLEADTRSASNQAFFGGF